ncbi:MAG: hypothetical protein IKN72_06115 [Clostridia bacterium]|nr:hypothetical protein [Clostridia bacterium]
MTVQAVLTKPPRGLNSLTGARVLNKTRLLLIGVLAVGTACGVGLYLGFGEMFASVLRTQVRQFESAAGGTAFWECFSGFAVQALLLWGAVALLGTSPVGAWLIHGAVFFKCAGVGALAAFFAAAFGKRGVGYYFLVIFPGKLLFFIGLLFLYETGVSAAFRVKKALKGEGALSPDAVRGYLVRLAVICGILLLGALVDTVTVRVFSGVFNLWDPAAAY